MTIAQRLVDRPYEPAARAAAFPRGGQDSAVVGSGLRDHLLHDHGRTGREIDGLPLAHLHRFEHVEQAMGLNDLHHRHSADGAPHLRAPADAEGAGHRHSR
jgi:hypothetical protein